MKTPIVRAALFTPLSATRWGLPLLLWGEPGVAKTALIEQVAAECGLACETLSPSERGEGAFGVVPVPVDGVLTNPRPAWTTKFDATGRGVVFVDELTTAAPALQAPIMGLVLARRIGGHMLPGGVRVLAAANPPEKAAGGYDLAHALANRLGHVEWHAPSVEEHTAFMLGQGIGGEVVEALDPEAEEARVLREWPEAWARAVGIETAFLARRPGLKNQCPDAGDPKGGRAWPSDRGWEHACRAWASAGVHDLSAADTEEFVASFIGDGVASELFAYAQEADLPDPTKLLDGSEDFTHEPKRLDRTMAVLNACAALVVPSGAVKRKPRADALWTMLAGMADRKADLDILVPCVHSLIGGGLHTSPAATKVLAKVQPILKAAGVRPTSFGRGGR